MSQRWYSKESFISFFDWHNNYKKVSHGRVDRIINNKEYNLRQSDPE